MTSTHTISPTRQAYYADSSIKIVNGVCPHDCPDTCSWQAAVQNEKAIDIWGNPNHTVTGGLLCGKVDRYLERTYHAERLQTPLKRIGPKGSGQFVPISWEEALDDIAKRLHEVIEAYGPEAVLPYSFAGTMGMLQADGFAQRFFNRLGASRLARTVCSTAGKEGLSYTIGAPDGMEPEAYAHARLILIWGSNTLTSNVHLWPFVQAAQKAGAHIVLIDPARTRTARAVENMGGEWMPIRPGTDAALALAMMHVIINENLYDHDYVERYTLGFAPLCQRVQEWTPAHASDITGIPAEKIVALARQYATTRPAAIRVNYGLQRHHGGGMAVRTIACLPALVGAWRDLGGGIQLSMSGAYRHFDVSSVQRPDLASDYGHPRKRIINMNRLGDALSLDPATLARAHYHPRPVDPVPSPAEAGPPVKAMIVYNCNPVAIAPDQQAVISGMKREDLLTVVLEHFQTDTADYADYVLPATTQLEHWDMHQSYGHLTIGLNQPAIPPIGESLPNSEIFRRLAQTMGYTDDCFYEDDEVVLRTLVESQNHPTVSHLTWAQLCEEGFMRLNVPTPYLPFAEGNYHTPSGKCEFYSESMAQGGYDPLPTYTPPRIYEQDSTSSTVQPDSTLRERMLVCISPPAHSYLNTSFANLERFQKRERQPLVQIHPHDAEQRQIASGDQVQVHNALGSLSLYADVTPNIIEGTVLAPGIWWIKHSEDGRNINQITPQDETDIAGAASFYDALVWVEKA
ncbi:MAG: molybdopterin-dependent oxidoreductase [Chloroflexota bacterium]